jgi:hypothetical protein
MQKSLCATMTRNWDPFNRLCAIRLNPDSQYGLIRTANTVESGHPIRTEADT